MVADKDDENDVRSSKNIFNFASQAAGAVVLDKSPSTAKGYSHLLNDDMDKYGISACDEKKWVVIGLSEDILVTSIALANYEKYSSMLKEFQLLASTSYPTEKWINLGVYEAQPRLGMQTFNVSDSSVHTRYLKVKFNSHYGTEDLCTLSQVRTDILSSLRRLKIFKLFLLVELCLTIEFMSTASLADQSARHNGHSFLQTRGGAIRPTHERSYQPFEW